MQCKPGRHANTNQGFLQALQARRTSSLASNTAADSVFFLAAPSVTSVTRLPKSSVQRLSHAEFHCRAGQEDTGSRQGDVSWGQARAHTKDSCLQVHTHRKQPSLVHTATGQ